MNHITTLLAIQLNIIPPDRGHMAASAVYMAFQPWPQDISSLLAQLHVCPQQDNKLMHVCQS